MPSTHRTVLAVAPACGLVRTGTAITPDHALDSLAGAGTYRVIGDESCMH